jgi:micrococcal nuclease
MYIYSAQVTKVIDGDTIEIDLDLGFGVWYRNQRVRLNGIDTPESRTKDKDEKTRGELSKNKLKELIENKIVKITTTIDPDDKFGRILAIIETKEGINVNEWLVTNNYAVAYKGQNKELVQEAHQKNTEILRARGELK